MIVEAKDYIDENGLMHLQRLPSELDGNAIIYTVTYHLLKYGRSLNVFNQCMYHYDTNGRYTMTPLIHDLRPASHDNITAIATAYAIMGNHLQLNDISLRYYLHPRDFIYLGMLQRRWWSYPLLPILFGIFLWMAITKYKRRPTLINWIKEGFPKRTKLVKTDTELLYWIRLHLPKEYRFIHVTKKLIEPLLRRKYGQWDWAKKAREIYYPAGHPCRM